MNFVHRAGSRDCSVRNSCRSLCEQSPLLFLTGPGYAELRVHFYPQVHRIRHDLWSDDLGLIFCCYLFETNDLSQRFAIGPPTATRLYFGQTPWQLLLYTTWWFDLYTSSAMGTNLRQRNLAFLVLAYIPGPEGRGCALDFGKFPKYSTHFRISP